MKFPPESICQVLCFHMETFAEWLQDELKKRGWKPADLAREMGVTDATVSRILNEARGVGKSTSKKIAKALKVDDNFVFYKAGIIDENPNSPKEGLDPITLDILSMLENRTDATKKAVRAAIEALLESIGDGRRADEDSKATAKPKR